ncbi:nephrin-like [Mytilus californianus]|uniref:nephrin-like n=1 Tax=Mytilus californianus TaxID=6549 RepID=UPI00224806B1|nr:nephrin-like [Mytilus californianus]
MGSSKGHIVLIINYGPNQVVLSPNETSYTLNEDSHVPDITCTADCQPDCNLMWIRPNGQVDSNNILSLKEIQKNQAGTYQCNASNVVSNMVSADVTISVLYGPEKVTLSPNTTEYTLNEGEHVPNINCSAEFGPSSVVLSPNKTKYTIKENESLQPSISCTATCQPHCVGTWTIHTGQPDIPTNFSASCDAPDSANLKWIPSFDGGDTQQFKLFYAVQDRQINLNKDGLQYADLVFSKSTIGPKFVIRGLENRTIYAEVDTSQKIEPLTDSDEDEPSDKNTNNEESGI